MVKLLDTPQPVGHAELCMRGGRQLYSYFVASSSDF